MIMYDDAEEMSSSSSAHVQRRRHEKGCLICNVKLAKKAWIARIDYTFEIEMQAMSGEKLPFVVRATGFPVALRTDDNDDNLSHHFNDDLVRGAIERCSLTPLAASMTMEEIFRRTISSSINHQAVFEFESVQLELKQFGRLIVHDASVYVKPQFVDVSGDDTTMKFMVDEEERRQRQDAARQTEKREQELKSSAEDGWEQQQAWVVQVEAHVDDEMKVQVQQEVVQSSERPSNISQVRESSWRRACQSLKPLIFQVIYSNDNKAGHLERQKKSWPNYTLNTLLFACSMLFSTYMDLSSSTSITIKILLVVDIVVFIIINAVHQIKLPNWGNALACISWFLLELAMCLLILPFNGCYALAILAVLFLIVAVALLQPKLQHSVKKYVLPSFTIDDGDTQGNIGDQENHYLNHLFDISNGIATCGGMVTGILGYYSYMEGPVTAAGFFFFSTVLLGLYLMMVIAMRAVSPPHAACLAIVLKALLLLTVITASVSFVRHSVTM